MSADERRQRPGPVARYVDWEFAKAAGARLVPRRPAGDARARPPASWPRCAAAASRAQQPVADTARLHAPGDRPGPLVVDRPTWIALNADSMSAMVDPVFAKLVGHGAAAAVGPPWPRSAARSPAARPVRCWRSWPARCSASTTSRPSGTPAAAARRPQHRPRRARARGRPRRLPALGLHARGDPPGAVHRRALAARPHDRAGPLAGQRDGAGPRAASGHHRPHQPAAARGAQERRRGTRRAARDARAAREARPRSPP